MGRLVWVQCGLRAVGESEGDDGGCCDELGGVYGRHHVVCVGLQAGEEVVHCGLLLWRRGGFGGYYSWIGYVFA